MPPENPVSRDVAGAWLRVAEAVCVVEVEPQL